MCSNIWLILIFPCISRVAGGSDTKTDGYGRQKQYLKHFFEVSGSLSRVRWDLVGRAVCCMHRGYVGGFHEFGWCFTRGFLVIELLWFEDVQTIITVAMVLDIYACEYQPT
jgi:hypothetical protein